MAKATKGSKGTKSTKGGKGMDKSWGKGSKGC